MSLVTNLVDGESYWIHNNKDILPEKTSKYALRVDIDSKTFLQVGGKREQIDDTLFWRLLMNNIFVQNLSDKKSVINDRIHKLCKTLDIHVDKDSSNNICKVLNRENISDNQEGGVLLKMIDDSIRKNSPKWLSLLFSGFLELIDITLIILSSMPGTSVISTGRVIDITYILYTILRADVGGLFGGLLSLIPEIGKMTGLVVKVSNKMVSLLTSFMSTPNYDPFTSYMIGEKAKMIELGRLYGSDVTATLNFLGKWGNEGRGFLEEVAANSLDGLDPNRVRAMYGENGWIASQYANQYPESMMKTMQLQQLLGDRGLYLTNGWN